MKDIRYWRELQKKANDAYFAETGKRLYMVNFEFTMFVVAKDDTEAERLAERHMLDEISDYPPSGIGRTAEFAMHSPDELRSIPWGSSDDRLVGDILGVQNGYDD